MSTTINKEEIQKFSKLADEWWDVKGKFKPLHMFNPIRIEYIIDSIKKNYNIKNGKPDLLKRLNILDIGCGGGLISEPMARLGANVTGIDASAKNIHVARLHSKENNLKINYLNTSPENLKDFALVVSNIIEGSIQESYSSLKQENMITIGSGLANSFGLKVGDSIVIYSPKSRQTISGPMPIKKPYTVGAIFKSGLYQADLSNIYMDINQTSLLFNKGLHSGEIQIRLSNPDELDKIRNEILNIIDEPVFIQSWKDRNASTATALRTEQIAMRFIFMVVVIIAVFPVLASMIMLVKNKSKDIAVLRTLGVSRAAILRIFFITGVSIGSVGTFSGVLLGILFCSNVEHIQSFLEFITGVELFPEDVYQLSGGIPSKVIWVEVFGVAFWGFLISALATFFPALTASRIDPVDALRYD